LAFDNKFQVICSLSHNITQSSCILNVNSLLVFVLNYPHYVVLRSERNINLILREGQFQIRVQVESSLLILRTCQMISNYTLYLDLDELGLTYCKLSAFVGDWDHFLIKFNQYYCIN